MDRNPFPQFDQKAKNSRGAQKRGYRFEKRVGKWLGRQGLMPVSGQWFLYHDENGSGYAQTDHLVLLKKQILLIECKLTQTESAFLQMSQLYVPILEHVFERPVMTLQVCDNLRYKPEILVHPLDLIDEPQFGNMTWVFDPR